MILPTSSECEGKSSPLATMTTTEEDIKVSDSPKEVKESPEEREVTKNSKKVPARRKPEKSRIVRVWQSDDSKTLNCPHCMSEVISEQDLKSHFVTCPRKDNSLKLDFEDTRPDPFLRYRVESSPEPTDTSMKENSQQVTNIQETSSADYSQVLKLLRHAVPQLNDSQQLALEMLLNAQMHLPRLDPTYRGNAETNNDAENRENALPLQHQQLLQFQLIQLLQAQLTVNGEKNHEFARQGRETGGDDLSDVRLATEEKERLMPSLTAETSEPGHSDVPAPFNDKGGEGKLFKEKVPQLRSSPSLSTKNISSLVIQNPDSPPASTPNTLEMLQKTADKVLNNASKGLLASRLIDSCREADNGEPGKRHRCRYCGKVFSSDSGLQIHIRSHTGERPFKCNICGNRFTTKGNLKVHFQRHTDQFPNVKMNPHPVPEHLDKFYPPLLPPNSENLMENTSMPASSPTSIVSPISTASPPFKSMGNRPSPLNLNFKSISETLLRPHMSDAATQDMARNFLDFRLFSPFLVPSLNKANTNPDLISDSQGENENKEYEERRGEEDQSLSEEISLSNDFNCENVKVEKEDEELSTKPESHRNQSKSSKKRSSLTSNNGKANHNDTTLDSLKLLHQNFMSVNLPESKNLYKDIINFRENSGSPEEAMASQPLDLKSDASKNEVNGLFQENEQVEETEEKKNELDDHESYMSDSSSGPHEKCSKPETSSIAGSPVELSHFPFLGTPVPPNLSFLPGFQPPLHGYLTSPPKTFPMPPAVDPSRMPHIYTNLLPRPGSSDNSWEALIEVRKSDEQKLEQLIDKNKEKPTEPNQCAICQRVLSCKSALQMHYRIHTGERPFKCKICSRSFTTKGNLKTHMSVHRAKPPMRMLQQCPICHKKFSNAIILQQHIRLHTGEPTDLSPEQIYAAEVREFPMDIAGPLRFPPMAPGGFPSHIPPRSPFAPVPIPLHFQSPQRPRDARKEESLEAKYGSMFNSSPRSSSTSSGEQHCAEDLSVRMRDDDSSVEPLSTSRSFMISPTLSDYSDMEDKSQEPPHKDDPQDTHAKDIPASLSSMPESSPYGIWGENSPHPLALSFHPTVGFPAISKEASIKPPTFPFLPPLGLLSSVKHGPNAMPSFTLPAMSPFTEGNTTCKVCFKVFACQSALEIHLRSHTKERPFKCLYCERGFSTKGNMKQHMATHRTRDGSADEDPQRIPLSPCEGSYENRGGRGSPPSSPPTSDDPHEDEKSDPSRIKREREGEISLPEAKRASGASESNGDVERDLQSPGAPQGMPSGREAGTVPETVRSSPSVTYAPFLPHPSSFSHFPLVPRSSPLPLSLPLPLPLPLSLPLSLASSLPLSKEDSPHG